MRVCHRGLRAMNYVRATIGEYFILNIIHYNALQGTNENVSQKRFLRLGLVSTGLPVILSHVHATPYLHA